jgi:2-polyprenyl-6-methoxyphenol hydroxylase-like FAD-dependent oxidoreductase
VTDYDIIAIGGGMGGACLATVMAEHGSKVLVVERSTHFTDRVRGEAMHPWGVAEVRELGLWPTYAAAGAHELPYWRFNPPRIWPDGVRHLPSSTPSKLPEVSFYHPTMQEALLQRAAEVGVDVWRGATVREVSPGGPPALTVHKNGSAIDLTARLVVAADGRSSQVRGWGAFEVKRDDDGSVIAGMLFDDMDLDDAATHLYGKPPAPGTALLFPQSGRRVRVYFIYPAKSDYRLNGRRDIKSFISRCIAAGVPETVLSNAKPAGPLASFNGADHWVNHPYAGGIALVGDAATSSDPGLGMGLSFTARDVRLLRDQLLSHRDWDEAGHAYATQHDRYYGIVRTWYAWSRELNRPQGPEADVWRAKLNEVYAQEPDRLPDVVVGAGPNVDLDASVKARFFADDIPEISRARAAMLAHSNKPREVSRQQ